MATDWEPDSGAAYLRELADFDQWVVGRNWANDAVVRLVWGDSGAAAAIPQLVLVEREVGRGAPRSDPGVPPSPQLVFGAERVVARFVSAGALASWVFRTAAEAAAASPSAAQGRD